MSILIRNITYLEPDCESWSVGDIFIRDGLVCEVGNVSLGEDIPDEVIDGSGKIAIPGLINAHSHSYTGYLKGTIENLPLDLYMLHAIAGGSFRSSREIYVSSALESLNMLKRGITAAVDHFSERPALSADGLEATAKGFQALGMKAKIATMFADRSFFDTVPLLPDELPEDLKGTASGVPQTADEYIALVEEAHLKYQENPLVSVMLGTDGPQRCSDELLQKTAALEEKYQMGWQTHILEAKTQAIVSNKAYGKGLIEHMDDLGVLNQRTSLVHHVWVSEPELALVRDRGCTVVHCPASNLHLGSGLAPADLYREMGIDVAVGSDGGNSGTVGILEQLKLIASLSKVARADYEDWFTAAEVLQLAYQGGAKVMGRKIGRIEIGWEADLTLLDIDNVFWQPVNNLSRQLVYYENGSNIDTVIIAGKKVLEQGRSCLIDEAELLAEAKEIAARLKKDNAQRFALVERQTPYFRKMYLREIKRDLGYNRFTREI